MPEIVNSALTTLNSAFKSPGKGAGIINREYANHEPRVFEMLTDHYADTGPGGSLKNLLALICRDNGIPSSSWTEQSLMSLRNLIDAEQKVRSGYATAAKEKRDALDAIFGKDFFKSN